MAIDVTVGDLTKPDDSDGLPAAVFTLAATVTDTDHPGLAIGLRYAVESFASVPVLHAFEIRQSGEQPSILPLSALTVRNFPLSSWDRAARGHVEERLRGPITLTGVVAQAMGVQAADGDTVTVTPEFIKTVRQANIRQGSGIAYAGGTLQGVGQAVEHDQALPIKAVKSRTIGTATARAEATAETIASPPSAEDYRRLGAQGVVDALNPGLRDSRKAGDMRTYTALIRMAEVAARYHENVLAGAHNPTAATADQLDLSVGTARALAHRARQAGLLPHVSR